MPKKDWKPTGARRSIPPSQPGEHATTGGGERRRKSTAKSENVESSHIVEAVGLMPKGTRTIYEMISPGRSADHSKWQLAARALTSRRGFCIDSTSRWCSCTRLTPSVVLICNAQRWTAQGRLNMGTVSFAERLWTSSPTSAIMRKEGIQ
jgi:hypothetical protein